MRRAHDRSSEDQVRQQGDLTGSGPGTTTGAAATGSSTGRETEGQYPTGTTSTTTYEQGGRYEEGGRHQQGGQQPYATGQGRYAQAPRGGSAMETGTSTAQGGLLLTLAGLLTFLVGLAFVVRSGFYHTYGLYAYNWGIRSWGWALFGLGIVTFAVGASHLLGLPFSRPVGILMAVLTTVAGFMIVPFYLVWGIIIVALGIAAIWGLAHGAERREQERRVDEYQRHMSRM
jgi:hypothetical protein